MPKQTRWAIKRKLDQVDTHLLIAEKGLAELGGLYEEHHPEIYDSLSLMIHSIESIRIVVNQQRDII